jgi:DNA polymerase (family 10)
MNQSLKQYIPHAAALKRAAAIFGALMPLCHRLAIAGSVRRVRPHCGDLDLVALPRDRDLLLERLRMNCTVTEAGERNITAVMEDGWPIGLYLAHGGIEPDMLGEGAAPSNFGALLLCRTGSKEFNVWFCQQAAAKGLKYSPYQGVLRDGKVIAGAEEEDVFHALGMAYIQPEARER